MEQIDVIGVLLNDVAREESDQVSVLDDVSKFPSFKPRIDGHAHRAQEGNREPDLEELDAVRHQDSDVITRSHTHGSKTARHLCRAFRHGEIGATCIREDKNISLGHFNRPSHE
jgi:hypothetical protein